MKKISKHIAIYFTLLLFLLATNGMSVAVHYCSSHQEKYVSLFQSDPECHEHTGGHHNECACAGDCCRDTKACSNENVFLKLLADILLADNNSGFASLLGFFIISNPVHILFQDYYSVSTNIFAYYKIFAESGRHMLSKISQFIL